MMSTLIVVGIDPRRVWDPDKLYTALHRFKQAKFGMQSGVEVAQSANYAYRNNQATSG